MAGKSGRKKQPHESSIKTKQGPSRLELQVGEKWPDGIVATAIEASPAYEPVLKAGVIVAIVFFCVASIAILTIHAMVIGDQQRLDSILKVAWKVLIGFGLWAIAAHQWAKAKPVVKKRCTILKE